MAQQIRGLTNFIGDIRNCKTQEEENERVEQELAKIRTCFSATSVTAYNKKKYMWKIMYMYLLGYSIDFGHMQCVDLINAESYSEKNVGYAGVSLLLIEHTDLLRLCIQSIKKDLVSRNEIFQGLALTCIANVGGEEFAESLTTDVQRLVISQGARNFVRKKASLTLLRLLRQYPDNVPPPEFAPAVIKLMEHRNVGVVTSIMSLLTGLATYDPHNYSEVVPLSIKLLTQFVLSRECSKDYLYYRTPCPWLQVKLLRILQYYPPPTDRSQLNKLHDVLDRIVTKTEVTQSVNKNNADHAILFEAINVIIHLNVHGQDMLHERAIQQLQKFIAVKEGNIRYLGLDAMSRLAKIGNTHQGIKKQLRTVQYSLDDQDISIRKRALDLLYSICDETNVEEIIDHLLRYLAHAEYAIREEMVLKIAILAEKFSSDLQWYINVVLQLITVAGDFITDDVWHRVVQIVTNNENLQEYAAQTVFENLQEPPVHESLVKVGGYILGEFGHLLQADGAEQFAVLHRHFLTSSLSTQALLLSTYMKFANLFEHLVPDISEIFRLYSASVDPEIQQRAVEYNVMANYSNQELISRVCEAMPEFPERESNLMRIAHDQDAARGRGGGGGVGESDGESSGSEDSEEGTESESDDEDAPRGGDNSYPGGVGEQKQPESGPVDLLGFDDFGGVTGGSSARMLTQDAGLFKRLLMSSTGGVMFENDKIRLECRQKVMKGTVVFKIQCVNVTSNVLAGLQFKNAAGLPDSLRIEWKPEQVTAQNIPPSGNMMVMCRVASMDVCSISEPKVIVSFQSQGQEYKLDLYLPVVATKFLTPYPLDANAFGQQWSSAFSATEESKKIFMRHAPLTLDQIMNASQTMGVTIIPTVRENMAVGAAQITIPTSLDGATNAGQTVVVLLTLTLDPRSAQTQIIVKSKHATPLVNNAVIKAFETVFGGHQGCFP